MRLQFGLDAFEHRSKSLAAQRLVNCYLEKQPDESSNPIALVGAYGIDDFTTVGNGPIRGGKVINGTPWVVSGNKLYEVDEEGAAIERADVPGTDRVSIAGDGTHVVVAASGWLYVWDGTEQGPVDDPDFPGCEMVEFLSTYFLVIIRGNVYISESLEPGSWVALNFISAEASPDDIRGSIVEKGELFAGGLDTIQSFVVTDSEVPLDRVPEGIAEIGLLSKYGFAKIDNSVFFPATDFTVRRLDGYLPIVISTPAISQAIEDLSSEEKAALQGMCWSESGHNFYGLTSSQWTFVYDASTQRWHQRKSNDLSYWKPLFALTAYNMVLVGDRDSNKLGKLSASVYTDWGEPVLMIGTCNVVDADSHPVFGGSLELVFERGVGNTGQGENPQVMMRQSFDGGRTWSSERMRPMGRTGEYTARAVWSRMGRAPHRVIEFSVADPVRRALSYATLRDPEVGD